MASVAAIVGAMPHDPELAQAFRGGVITWRKQAMTETLDRAVARREVRPDVRFEVARELGQAVLWHRFLVTGDPIAEELIEHLVDHILIPYTGLEGGPESSLAGVAEQTPGHPVPATARPMSGGSAA